MTEFQYLLIAYAIVIGVDVLIVRRWAISMRRRCEELEEQLASLRRQQDLEHAHRTWAEFKTERARRQQLRRCEPSEN